MKVLIFGLALFVSAIALADDCPVLVGTYSCDTDVPTKVKIKQVEQNGVQMYKINGRASVADGLTKSAVVVLRDGQVVTRKTTNSCSWGKLIINEQAYVENELTGTNYTEYSIDAWGDLSIAQEIVQDGRKTVVDANCERISLEIL